MKAIVDTNIVLDVLLQREGFYDDSYQILSLIAQGKIDGWFPAGCVADVFYILRRAGLDSSSARMAVLALTKVVPLCETHPSAVTKALGYTMNDLEDAILAATAQRIGAEVVITRNIKDYVSSPVEAWSPSQVLDSVR
ncbi:MAG: PIN domain-containing protein [Propionibacteriaceae bacterium]|nr:PIN domain-containing protein [Propionibacteriaceae bacterium]